MWFRVIGAMFGVHRKYKSLARYDQVHAEDEERDDHDEDYINDTEQRESLSGGAENDGQHDNDYVARNVNNKIEKISPSSQIS